MTGNSDFPGQVAQRAHRAELKDGPLVLMCCTPIEGHLAPLLQIAKHLLSRGYNVFFLASKAHKSLVERAGAKYLPTIGAINFCFETDLMERYPDFYDPAPGVEQLIWFTNSGITGWLPSGLESLRRALSHLHEIGPEREKVLICDTWWSPVLAMKLGAELPEGYTKQPKTLGISVIPASWTSVDTGILGSANPPDTSDEGRKKNCMIAKLWAEGPFKDCTDKMKYTLKYICGAPTPLESIYGDHGKIVDHYLWDCIWACHNTTLQMCVPALELERSDWPATFKFGGTLPKKALNPDLQYPPWWEEVVANSKLDDSKRKKVVMVGQGTVIADYNIMVLPALRALGARSDLLIVAVLGIKNATLTFAEGEALPANTRVVDYFPYDAILPYVDVFAVTGGYGSLQHGVINGVPLVLGGDTEDKPEVSLRAERAGMAVNLRTGKPTPELIAESVNRVLTNPSYKARAMALMKEAEDFKALDVVEREMLALLE